MELMKVIQFLFYFHNAYQNKFGIWNLQTMNPHHRLMMLAIKNALIVIAAFALYDLIEEFKVLWKHRFPESEDMHAHYGRLLHLFSVFIADLAIGLVMYYLFNFIH